MQPKRKEGICLSTSPFVTTDQHSGPCGTTTETSFTSFRQPCSFTTFKGHSGAETKAPIPCRGSLREKGAPGAVPQMGSLDDLVQRNLGPMRIEPFDFKKNLVMGADEEVREPFKFAGYLLVALSSLTTVLGMLAFKLLPIEDNLEEKAKTCMIRGFLMSICCAISIWTRGESFLVARGEYMINFFRSFIGATNIFLFYVAMRFITMGETSAVVFSSPLWTCVLSALFLREPLRVSLVVVVPASLLGTTLLARPDMILDTGEVLPESNLTSPVMMNSSLPTLATAELPLDDLAENSPELHLQERLPGFIIAFSTSLGMSIVIIILKFRKKTPVSTCTLYMGLTMGVECFLIQCVIGFGALPVTIWECSLHLLIGVCSFASQYFFQSSLVFVPAATFAVIRNLDIVLSYALGTIFLGEVLLPTSVAGSILIMLAVSILMLNEHIVAASRRLCGCCKRHRAGESKREVVQ